MPELWFFVGLVVGILVTGFVAVGSFERGADSVRSAPWRLELAARQAVLPRRGTVHAAAQRRLEERTVIAV